MSARTTPTRDLKPVLTNLKTEDMIMDDRGSKDSRYYCLPPFHGSTTEVGTGGGYPFHLVTQGHRVGTFTNWLEAKVSLTGYPGNANRGYHTKEECIDAWQLLCTLGIHPHPVDPACMRPPSASATALVNTSPRKSRQRAVAPQGPSATISSSGQDIKAETDADNTAQLLANLKRYSSPILPSSSSPSPRKRSAASPPRNRDDLVNFAIRGGGIVSSSPMRTEERYRAMQHRGEEPDLLVTRNLQRASRFALAEEEEDEVYEY
ncbi:hypothetical protein C8R47DRAFT_1073119 [Mycena vitilis]|nr:hypothetical protein C8R47DRAFT_1073119 [Mycena vitilis]